VLALTQKALQAPHIFSYLWSRHNLTDIEANKWREGGLDWVEVCSVCLLYWYKSTNTDVNKWREGGLDWVEVCSVFLLYWCIK
jgi:hypothetical protein